MAQFNQNLQTSKFKIDFSMFLAKDSHRSLQKYSPLSSVAIRSSCCLIEEKPLQAQQRMDHVFAYSLCPSLILSPDLAVDVDTCVAPTEDLLDQGKADELFLEKQRDRSLRSFRLKRKKRRSILGMVKTT